MLGRTSNHARGAGRRLEVDGAHRPANSECRRRGWLIGDRACDLNRSHSMHPTAHPSRHHAPWVARSIEPIPYARGGGVCAAAVPDGGRPVDQRCYLQENVGRALSLNRLTARVRHNSPLSDACGGVSRVVEAPGAALCSAGRAGGRLADVAIRCTDLPGGALRPHRGVADTTLAVRVDTLASAQLVACRREGSSACERV